MKDFFEDPRQNNSQVIPNELSEFAQQQKNRRVAVVQMRNYMVASHKGEVRDKRVWIRYKYDEPSRVLDFSALDESQKVKAQRLAKQIMHKTDEVIIKATAKMQ